ncbi:unnamed protein product [Toxocara canis]|uniref:Uncharacterized protein n=1 Tax=Toxocara canis TaxID=6265 RepID=A0A183UD53_TOXCA|nr:unnamed protein product [Toxocara canis]
MNPKAIQCNRTGRIASPNNPPSPPQDPTAASLTSSIAQTTVICTTSSVTSVDDKSEVQKLHTTCSSASSPSSERSVCKRAYTVSALLDLPLFSPSPSANETRYEFTSKHIEKISHSVSPLPAKEASEICDEIPCKRAKNDASEKLISRLLTLQENVSQLRHTNYTISDSILDLLTRPCAMDNMTEYTKQNEESELDASEMLSVDVALAIEYAKSFDVFRKMPLDDKVSSRKHTPHIQM